MISPSTASRDRGEKKPIYEKNGVRKYWVVNVLAKTLTRFVLQGDRFRPPRIFESGDEVTSEVLSGFVIRLDDLLPEP